MLNRALDVHPQAVPPLAVLVAGVVAEPGDGGPAGDGVHGLLPELDRGRGLASRDGGEVGDLENAFVSNNVCIYFF